MSATYEVIAEAAIDIEGFRLYLRKENGESVAEQFLDYIYKKFEILATRPGMGISRIKHNFWGANGFI